MIRRRDVAVGYAEHVLHIFETRRPGDARPRDLLVLLRKWLANPESVTPEQIREARRAAAADADAAAADAAYAAAAARKKEHAWQRARLAAYVLLEARP